jgi:hypothetical protein
MSRIYTTEADREKIFFRDPVRWRFLHLDVQYRQRVYQDFSPRAKMVEVLISQASNCFGEGIGPKTRRVTS